MSPDPIVQIKECRSCGSDKLKPVFDLGQMPLSDGFVASGTEPDAKYPLKVVFCEGCSLAQLEHTVAPEILFADDYPYFSSYTDTVVQNAALNVDEALERTPLGPDGLVVELASNDGYLLKHAMAKGHKVLGIDPAKGPVEAARAQGVETIHAFFGEDLAKKLAGDGVAADLIFGNNVLAHVADTSSFVNGIGVLLKPTGTAIIEVPYLKALIEHKEFDTIYHEHLCYFSVTALSRLFERRGLYLNDIKPLAIHGGSLRLFIEKQKQPTERLKAMLADEKAIGLDKAESFTRFADDVNDLGRKLKAMLQSLKKDGASIAAYGAAAKGTILVNHFGIGADTLDYVVDRNPHKQGLFVPGVKLPIKSPAALDETKPDYVLILAWNHKDEIIKQLSYLGQSGTRFVVPIPDPVIVEV